MDKPVENYLGRTKSEHMRLVNVKKIEGAETPDIYYGNASVAERQ